MEIVTTIKDGVAVLHLDGRLTMVAAPGLRATIDETVGEGHPRIVVDLTTVSFIDSSGLGALVAGLRTTRQAGGDLRVVGPSEQVQIALRLTNLDRVLWTHDGATEAPDGW